MNSAATEAALIAQINTVLGRIEGKTNELQSSINSKLQFMPAGLADNVKAGWDEFCGFMSRIWDSIREFFASFGSPSALIEAASRWSDGVGGPVSAQVQMVEAGQLTADDNWSGSAADAYRRTLPLQKAALDKIKSGLTDAISTALTDVASGVRLFWAALIGALVALAAGIVGALASTATVFGAPAGPPIAIGAALVASAAIFTATMNLESVCTKANTSLQQKLTDDTVFGNGHWPPAAVTG